MTPQADVRAIHTIDDLSNALARFAGAAGESLSAVQAEIKRTQEYLQKRLEYWQKEVRRREQELARAQRALAACQSAASRDREHRSCSAEKAAVERARRALEEARRELEKVQLWIRRVNAAVQPYQRAAGQLRNLAADRTGQARAFLSRKSIDLKRYTKQSLLTAKGWISRTASGSTPSRTYSVAYEMKLKKSHWGISDYRHFKEANLALASEMRASLNLEKTMNKLIPNARYKVESAGGRGAPKDWVWHHDAARPGVMQLVPRSQHSPGSAYWKTLHPGNIGGYAKWAVPAGAKPR